MDSAPGKWSIAELIERCSRRPAEEDAWNEFVRRYHRTIEASVQKTYQIKAREEADRKPQFPPDFTQDLVQSVYIKLIEEHCSALSRFEGEHENSIYQYLTMISTNVVRDYFRETRAQKRPKISFSLDELLETTGDAAIIDASSRSNGNLSPNSRLCITREEVDSALKRVASGKNRDRDILIFRLRYYEGLTLEEITKAMHLDISAISVGSILNRMIKKLRDQLTPSDRGK